MWHERAYTNSGTLERHLVDECSYEPTQNAHILGAYNSTKILSYNSSTFTDNGTVITRLRVCPHLSNENYRLFCSRLWLDMQNGVGLVSGQGSNPQVMLDWSDNGGHTWSYEKWASAGELGKYNNRVYWNRLGSFRDRVFRFKITDPVEIIIIDATLEVRRGRS